MEKSHHQVKAANQAHTAHGGGKARISVLLQQFQHWYRNRQHRYNKKLECLRVVHTPDDEARGAAAYRRHERWHQSNAANALENWRSRRRRVGKAWVTEDSVGGGGDGFREGELEWNCDGDMVGNGDDNEEERDAANDVDIEDAANDVAIEDAANDVDIEDVAHSVDIEDAYSE